MTKKRYLDTCITADLREKMVFIGGPRQIGKTTLAKYIGEQHYPHFTYLNWDSAEDRKQILRGQFDTTSTLLIFDEIHKYRLWKNYIKGLFDKKKDQFHILVTGSARLDVYRRGGDSLLGRYHYYRLHPFSLREVCPGRGSPSIEIGKTLLFPKETLPMEKQGTALLAFGGFPEPFLRQSARTLRRFHTERTERLIKEDIRDIESVRDLSSLQVLADLLPSKVGSLLSLNALKEDLQVSHKTVSLWIEILEKFYYHFRIYPFAASSIKSLRKAPKSYLWDWSQVQDAGARLENMVASHLLKWVHFLRDTEGYKAELYFLRDQEEREVDFLVTIDKQPWFAVEVKSNDQRPTTALSYFQQRLSIPFVFQLVRAPGVDFEQKGVRVMSVFRFLAGLV